MLMKFYYFLKRFICSTIFFVICVILATFISSYSIYTNTSRFTPAKDNDYEEIMFIKDEISNDFSKIYNYDNYTITPTKDDMICVTLDNQKCQIKCYFKKDLSIEKYEKQSKHIPILDAILLWFISFIVAFIGIILINIVTISLIEWIAEKKHYL